MKMTINMFLPLTSSAFHIFSNPSTYLSDPTSQIYGQSNGGMEDGISEKRADYHVAHHDETRKSPILFC